MQVIPVDLYESLEELDPKTKAVILKLIKYWGEIVRREDFLELNEEVKKLTKAVAELTEAQKSAEERLTRLEKAIAELTEAQKSAEERLTRLEKAIAELTEAQKSAEERLTRLEKAIAELTEAQKRTEERLEKLIDEHRKTREQLGGLAHSIGYFIENEAYKYLPALLQKDFNIKIEGRLIRDYIEVALNKYEEINIYGKGKINGKSVVILGEAKSQLKKSDIDSFLKKVEKISKFFPEEKILICVTHQTSPQIRKYAESKGIKLYFTYEFF